MSKRGGLAGMKYTQKSFSNYGEGTPEPKNVMSEADRTKLVQDDNGGAVRQFVSKVSSIKVMPFGDRILVRRRKIGDKLGSGIIIAADETKERSTDLADVVYVPDNSFADEELIKASEDIVKSLTVKSIAGDAEAMKALLEFNLYLKHKAIRPGDGVMISKYVGTTFHDNAGNGDLTLVLLADVIGVLSRE